MPLHSLGVCMSAALILSWLCLQTPGTQSGDIAPELTSGIVRRLREQLEQAEAELEANRSVIKDSKVAKHREQLLSFSSLEPGLVLMSVPKGHSASAKEVQFIKADQKNIIAEYEQTMQALSMTAKSQETQKRRAQKDLLKLREYLASSSGMSSSAQNSADLETSSLVQELSGVYRRLDEAKQQIIGLQDKQAQLFAKSEAETQSVAMATAEVVTLKQELADNFEHAQALAADLASAQEAIHQLTTRAESHVKSSRKEQNQQLEDVTVFLEEANSNNTALELESAHGQHSELYSKLTLEMDYLQRVHLIWSGNKWGDATRRSLRDLKDAQVQALHTQSTAFEQTLHDAKTVAAQDILKFAAALDESKHKESELVQRLQRCQLELHQQTAALRGEVVDSRNKHMQAAHRLQDAEEELEQEVAALQVKVHEANSRASGAATSLADTLSREQDLSEHMSQKQAIEAWLLGKVHDLATAEDQLTAAQAKEQDLFQELEAFTHGNNLVFDSSRKGQNQQLEDVTAFLEEANSNNAALEFELESASQTALRAILKALIENGVPAAEAVDRWMDEFFGLQDLEREQREGDATRRSLRDLKDAQSQALHAQSAAFEQTLNDAKTKAAQDILKFAAALDESKHKESELVQRLQRCELELHQQTAALRGEVVESRNKHMQAAHRLQDAEEELEQEVAALQVKVHEANSRASGAATSLADALSREQDLSEHLSQKQAIGAGLLRENHDLANRLAAAQAEEQDLVENLACKHAKQKKLQAQVCGLASQLNAALASPHQGTGSRLGQLQKEVLSLTDKLAEQQSKTAQAEAAATLMQISVNFTQKVSDASPRPASPLVAFSPYSLLAWANSTSPSEAASLSRPTLTHVPLSEPLGVHALGTLSSLIPVSPAVGLSATALTALSSMSHCSPLVRPSAPALRAVPSASPASSALHASAPALRALSSLSLADGSVLQSAPALRALSSLNSVRAVPGSPDARRALSSVGEWTGFQTPPSVALAHMPSPLQTKATTPSSSPCSNPAETQLLSNSAAHDFVRSLELVLSDLTLLPPLTGASAGLLLTGGTSSSLRCSSGPATDSPSPARVALSSSPVASLAASQPRIPVKQTKKQKAVMDCVAKKLVTAMPGLSGTVSLSKAAVHSREGMSVHSAALQRKSRMSVGNAGGRSPFGDMTNNIDVAPNRFPKLLQGDSKSRAGSRFGIGGRPLSSPSTAVNRRLSMPTIAGGAQQGQENTPPSIHPARQTILGSGQQQQRYDGIPRLHNRAQYFPSRPLETGVPKTSPRAMWISMGVVIKEPVMAVSIGRDQADAAVTLGLALGSPVRPPSLIENTCRDLDTVGLPCGSPANPSSISRNALGSAAQSLAPSGASLSSEQANCSLPMTARQTGSIAVVTRAAVVMQTLPAGQERRLLLSLWLSRHGARLHRRSTCTACSCALGLCQESQQLQAAAPDLHAQQGIRLQSMEGSCGMHKAYGH
ncbi:TPA: hypothetical protein ACH3X1_012790 [Trebouxia sp. C0004]